MNLFSNGGPKSSWKTIWITSTPDEKFSSRLITTALISAAPLRGIEYTSELTASKSRCAHGQSFSNSAYLVYRRKSLDLMSSQQQKMFCTTANHYVVNFDNKAMC